MPREPVLVSAQITAGAAVRPLVGGALLEFFWWGSAFLIGVPVMVLLIAVGPVVLPEHRDPAAARLDLPGAGMSLVAVLAVIYGLKQIAETGLAVPPVLAILAGLVIGAVFVRRQLTQYAPLLDLRLFGDRTFSVALGALTVSAVVMDGVSYLTAQYLQLMIGLSPLEARLWMLPPLGVGIVSMMLAPVIVRRLRPGSVIGAGLALAAVGFTVVSQVGGTSGLGVVVTGLTVVFAGLMPVSSLGVDLVVSTAPPERAGAASAISETTKEFGLALGIAILGSVATAVYRGQLTGAVPEARPDRDRRHGARHPRRRHRGRRPAPGRAAHHRRGGVHRRAADGRRNQRDRPDGCRCHRGGRAAADGDRTEAVRPPPTVPAP